MKIYTCMSDEEKNQKLLEIIEYSDKQQKVGEIGKNAPEYKKGKGELLLEELGEKIAKEMLLDSEIGSKCFFTIQDLKRTIKNSKEYKNLDNIFDAIEHLKSLGFIDVLDKKIKRGYKQYNVYYLTEDCNNIKTTYKTDNEDIIYALNTIFTLIQENPADRTSEYVWGFKDLESVFDDYKQGFDVKTLKRDLRNCKEDGLKLHKELEAQILNLC